MDAFRILTCPVCDQSACFHGGTADREALKAAAWDHLEGHRLPENKHAIYGVMMVEQLDRRTVADADGLEDEVGEWVDQLSLATPA